ncbi:MAG: hypothetical protein NTX27_12580 [Verrucomicrobia bacterium]|nr:hypothetical protein [Verrucomicrobiota bacterium]
MCRPNMVLRSASISLHAASYHYDEASLLRAVASGHAIAQASGILKGTAFMPTM